MNQVQPAIPAHKNFLGDLLTYWLLVRRDLWNSFDRVRVQICGPLPRRAEGPLICYLNHPSWWDGYLAAVVNREVLQRRFAAYVMMEELQLRIYPFMTWSGAFSVDRHNRREAARSVEYISQVLRERKDRAFYIFPQGEITPNDRRPLEVYPGVVHVAKRVGSATLCPIALRYEFRGEQRPEALIRFGPCHRVTAPIDVPALTREVQERLTASADALCAAIIADDMSNFRVLLHGRPGIDRFFDPLMGFIVGQRRTAKK